jgi:hypothetical protein
LKFFGAQISTMRERPDREDYGTHNDNGDQGAVDISIVRSRSEKELNKHQKHTAGYQARSHNCWQIGNRHFAPFYREVCLPYRQVRLGV